jgi:hypothetical protein
MTNPNEDYYRWTQETIEKLRQGKLNEINIEHLIEEIEDMGKSERWALESRLSVLLGHLLKWQYQPEGRSYSWQGTINGQRKKLHRLLRENPSLRPRIPEFGEEAYLEGIQLAVEETNKPESTFPTTFEQTGWSWEQVLDMEYLPD